MEHLPLKFSAFAVDLVAEDRMAEVLEMDTDLVCPAGMKRALYKRSPRILTEDAPPGASWSTAIDYRHFLPMHWMPSDRLFHFAERLAELSGSHCQIDFGDLPAGELPDQ